MPDPGNTEQRVAELEARVTELQQRLVDERIAMADRCDEALRRAEDADAELAHLRAEMERIQSTRTFRWTKSLRSLYARVRG